MTLIGIRRALVWLGGRDFADSQNPVSRKQNQATPANVHTMEHAMTTDLEEKNKKVVLEAFDTLFNKRNYEAAEKYWSPNYLQHSAHIPPGRDGLLNLIKTGPPNLRYEAGLIVANCDYVYVHATYTNVDLLNNWIGLYNERI